MSYLPDRVPLHGPKFAADPHAAYAELRRMGPVGRVELSPGAPAYLVTDYRAALDLLHDTDTWSKDTRPWQQNQPADSPLVPMLGWRPNALFNDGKAHERYRSVITDSYALIEPHQLRRQVSKVANQLIGEFAAAGEADLIGQYARRLPLLLFHAQFGADDQEGPRLEADMAGMLDSQPDKAIQANINFANYITELIRSKRLQRGQDLTSWFMDHPAALTPDELADQIVLTMLAGNEPTANLIGNALSRMLSNPAYYSSLSSGALTAHDAINDVLRNEPPMANYSAHVPRHAVHFHGTWIRPHELVLVSYHAANTEPGPTADEKTAGGDDGAHLAWAAGPHSCPVKKPATLIATVAIEQLTRRLHDLELGVPRNELRWRPGGFHRALAQLPARFTPIAPDPDGVSPWTSSSPYSSTRQDKTWSPKPPACATSGPLYG
ncbi:cytochrome P450 [Streptomyces niveus]|uniref:cytochrome P450 n=1 Tax=Streptomyces niveus TaxID=193462 RepID=UPI0036936A65